MRAILVEAPGGAEALQVVEQPVPEPAPGEVRVRLHAVGVNFADVMCRRGEHPGMRQPPIVVGCEGAGIVDALGPDVDRLRVGDRVGVYSPFGGAYAEWMTVPEAYALPLPQGMSFETGAAFTHVYLTAYHALATIGRVRAGETLFVTAAAGGLGLALIQLGRAWGLRVIVGAGSDEKLHMLRGLGFAEGINYRRQDVRQGLSELTDGRGIDVAVDTVAGPVFRAIEDSLAPLGRLVTAGVADRVLPEPNVTTLLARCATYSTMNLSVIFSERPDLVPPSWQTLAELYTAGKIDPVIGHRFQLAAAAAAQTLMESRGSMGKILLLP